jgi:hypothetical protein
MVRTTRVSGGRFDLLCGSPHLPISDFGFWICFLQKPARSKGEKLEAEFEQLC